MTSKITKKKFEEMMNDKYGVELSKWGNGKYAAQKRPYGTYLRSQDSGMFNMLYEEYLETGEL